MTATWEIRQGDALAVLRMLETASVQTCVTSPPYYNLRDYGSATWDGGDAECQHAARRCAGPNDKSFTNEGSSRDKPTNTCRRCGAVRIDDQLGLEATPQEFVAKLVAVFREVRRVLRDDGVVWCNMGNTYSGSGKGARSATAKVGNQIKNTKERFIPTDGDMPTQGRSFEGFPAKCLIPIAWMLGLAMIEDGWILRNDAIWSKPNAMPTSASDRLTVAHEYLLLFSKKQRYYWDAQAIAELATNAGAEITLGPASFALRQAKGAGIAPSGNGLASTYTVPEMRNKRDVWEIPTAAFPEAHFATYPTELITPCILAGSKEGDTVLDPFCGSGTTGLVALRHGRSFIGLELNPTYVEMSRRRITDDAPMLNAPLEVTA